MYCPECGNDAGSAKFCPECGANLAGVKDALSGKATAEPAASTSPADETPSAGGPSRLSPAVIWGGFGALAVVVIIVVVIMSGGFGGGGSDNTSGSYDQLVKRANDLYDKGDAAFKNQQLEQGSAYFAAAAKVYAAAWAKKATDPGVGTDYAVTLFYSGDIPAALKQIDVVLKANPDYQKAWLNKGIFVSHQGQLAKQQGDTKQASSYFDEARTALAKAVALDPKSDAGKQADSFMASLPN
jgi:tetratricopeptide (TPR) repeat protein